MSNIAHTLEERMMECWSIVDDIKIVYEELLDSPDKMDEDELANILLGMEQLYNRKFDRMYSAFEDVCEHGGVWLDEDLVTVAKQHRDYGEKLDDMFDDVEFKGVNVEFPTKEDNHLSEPPDEYNDETQEDINKEWERYEA